MNIKYHKWLDCVVKHNYFKDGESSIFGLLPLEVSARKMSNYSILLNSSSNTFSLYCGIKDEETFDPSSHLSGIKELFFQLIVSDISFFNYTNLPFNSEEQTYLLSNMPDAAGSGKLHIGEFVSDSEQINTRPNIFDYIIPSGEHKIEIKDDNGTVLVEQEFSNTAADSNFVINLQNEELGFYEIWLDNNLVERFFLIDQRLQPDCMGIVQINIETMLANYEEGMLYKIAFETRSVFKQYKVVVPDSRGISVLEMTITGVASENYEGPVEEEFMPHQMANVFTSDTALPLQQTMDKSPLLKVTYTRESTDEDSMELKLPNPDVESISSKKNEENEISFYSTSIIYV